MTADEDLWRALIADAIHGDDDVFQPLLETANAFEHALAGWLRDLCPDAPALHEPAVVRRSATPSSASWSSTCRNPRAAATPLAARARELAHVFARVAPDQSPIRCR